MIQQLVFSSVLLCSFSLIAATSAEVVPLAPPTPSPGSNLFSSPTNFVAGSSAGIRDMAIGDFNSDAVPDLVVVGYNQSAIFVFLGDGLGGFKPFKNITPVDDWAHAVAVSDVNLDGSADIVVTGGYIYTYLGDGIGGFSRPWTMWAGSTSYVDASIADINRDGKPDLVAASNGQGSIAVFPGDGTGHFLAPNNFYCGQNPNHLTLADLNRDGILDVAVGIIYPIGGLSVLLGNPYGGFGPAQVTSVIPNPGSVQNSSVAIGDVNKDGYPDILQGSALFLGNATGSFQTFQTFIAGEDVKLADVNRDGNLDILGVNRTTDKLVVRLGNGAGSFGEAGTYATGAGLSHLSAMADFDRNGRWDVATSNFSYPPPATISILYGIY